MSLVIDLLRDLDREPRYHGNGFVQLYIAPKKRLPIWHPEIKKLDNHNAQIHNHRYDVHSTVLYGLLKHKIYYLSYGKGDELYPYDDGHGHDLEPEDRPWQMYDVDSLGELLYRGGCYATLVGEYNMATGSVYDFPCPWYHTSDADKLTATIFGIGPDKIKRPTVLAPRGEKPTDAFDPSRAPPASLLWDVIEETLKHGDVAGSIRQELEEK